MKYGYNVACRKEIKRTEGAFDFTRQANDRPEVWSLAAVRPPSRKEIKRTEGAFDFTRQANEKTGRFAAEEMQFSCISERARSASFRVALRLPSRTHLRSKCS